MIKLSSYLIITLVSEVNIVVVFEAGKFSKNNELGYNDL